MAAKRLNQVLAVEKPKRSRAESEWMTTHNALKKAHLLSGMSRKYRPINDEGEVFPPESVQVQFKTVAAIQALTATLTDWFDVVASKEWTNTGASADVMVDETVLLSKVPVTYLLFLEKQLVELRDFIQKLPTLDPAEKWEYDSGQDLYATESYETVKTKKVPAAFVKYPATKEHPAQVEYFHEDVTQGYWTNVRYSGALEALTKNQLVERVMKLQDAVKFAREEANMREAIEPTPARSVLDFLFAPVLGSPAE